MKLVLKHNSTIKLYNEKLDYNTIVNFVIREMNLLPEDLHLSFTDEEGDEIAISTDEDLNIMEALSNNKPYLKITVQGQVNINQSLNSKIQTIPNKEVATTTIIQEEQKEPQVEQQDPKVQQKQESETFKQTQKVQQEQVQKLVQEREAHDQQKLQKQRMNEQEQQKKITTQQEEQQKKLACLKEEKERKKAVIKEQNDRKKAAIQEEKEKKKAEKLEANDKKKAAIQEEKEKRKAAQFQKQQKQQNQELKVKKVVAMPQVEVVKTKAGSFANFNRLMAETISSLVDERVRALIPFIKEETLSKAADLNASLEQLVHENYTCMICSAHPIVGIRYECLKCESFSICEKCEAVYDHEHNLMKIKKIEQKNSHKKIEPCIRKLYDNFFAQKPTEKKVQDNEAKKAAQRFELLSKPMKQIFGGKPADYKQLIISHNLNLRQMVLKYCELNGLHADQGNQKYSGFLGDKLVTKFKKTKEQIMPFVEENMNLEYEQLEKKMSKLIKQQKNKQAQKVKETDEWRIEERFLDAKVEEIPKIDKPLEEEKVEKIEEKKQEKAEEKKQQKVEQKKSPGAHLLGEKLEIYNLMVEFFGQEQAVKYPNFIEAHFVEGSEQIIQRWSDNISVYIPQ